MTQFNKKCPYCLEIGHSGYYCKKKPYKPIAKISKKRLLNPVKKVYKPINKIGKKAKEWEKTKKEWKKLNPPDYYGYYYCKVGGYALTDYSFNNSGLILNICHDKSRARFPELAFNLDNLFPGCQKHNKNQGSMDLDEFLETNPDLKCGNF